MVYVLGPKGNPLMPTARHRKVRHLLRDHLAVVVKRTPFTIRLLYDTPEIVQEVALGVDAGTTHVGFSATTDTKELYASEVTLRTDIVELLSSRREARRTRRSRKTRYREPRFNNRHHAKFAPSVEQKIQSHLKLMSDINRILPISRTVIEVAQFDIQKIKNPDIEGKEYQQGDQMGSWNAREYALCRDGYTCQHCHGKSKDHVLEVHHIESRKTGGDSPDNLVTLCKTCHDAYHKGEIALKITRASVSLRDAAVMNIMRWELYERASKTFSNVSLTYGYITKYTRISNGLEKSHCVDARCISGNPLALPTEEVYLMRQTRRHNRKIHKSNILTGGRKKRNQSPYLVKGFRLFDKVAYKGEDCFIFGRRSSGSFDIRLIDGTKVNAGISYRKLTFLEISRRYLITTLKRDRAIPPTPKDVGILAHLS